jgi:hypothetical protein
VPPEVAIKVSSVCGHIGSVVAEREIAGEGWMLTVIVSAMVTSHFLTLTMIEAEVSDVKLFHRTEMFGV